MVRFSPSSTVVVGGGCCTPSLLLVLPLFLRGDTSFARDENLTIVRTGAKNYRDKLSITGEQLPEGGERERGVCWVFGGLEGWK